MIRYKVMVALLIGLIVWGAGCGELDAGAPAAEPREDSEETRQQVSQRAHPFEENDAISEEEQAAEEEQGTTEEEETEESESAQVVVPMPEPQPEPDPSQPRCAQICFKALWCHSHDEPAFEECMLRCESDQMWGGLAPEIWSCVDDAATCEEVSACEEQAGFCEEVCEVRDFCEEEVDERPCQEWCGARFWEGRLTVVATECVHTYLAEQWCPALSACGLEDGD